MELDVIRYSDNGDSTLGLLFINSKWESYTLEDEHRDVKVKGETRIPAGRYQIKFRTVGGFHGKYVIQYGAEWHKGMLELQNVPNFKYILIHAGNHEGHTAGCLLVGETSNDNKDEKGFIGASRDAYKDIYPQVRDALIAGEEVWITYHDFDKHYILRDVLRTF
ncbi:MAG TPA: hypothetical protein DCY51_01720 [Bacteroidetes bacterium]|nr:hypothetical protein [Bacteroidota bacterium]